MKARNALILLLFFLIGCKEEITTKEYFYPNGKIFYTDYLDKEKHLIKRERHSLNGNIVAYINYKSDAFNNAKFYHEKKLIGEYSKLKDGNVAAKFYDNNTIIHGIGKIDSLAREIGWWRFYVEKKLIQKRYSLIINYNSESTQVITYKNGKIDSLNSQFANISFKRENNSNYYKGRLTYNRTLNAKSYVSILLSTKINDNFSNLESANFDTIVFKNKSIMEFPVAFEKSGKKKLKGFIVEQYSNDGIGSKQKKVEMVEKRTPFQVELLVD